MLWTIMILTQPSRTWFLTRLLARLRPQVLEANYPERRIELMIRQFDRSMSLGDNRQSMVESASGDYVCFVDDDDLVPEDYVKEILPLLDGVDQIGFRVQTYIDDSPLQPTYHSVRYKCWNADSEGYYRDHSHVNPTRRELVLKVKYSGGIGEDARWSDGQRALGLIKTEHYIDKVMYLYYYRSAKADHVATPPITAKLSISPNPRTKECPKCKATCVTVFSNGWRCNNCGNQFDSEQVFVTI